jgi:CheY-like chemotaxis protein
MTAKRALIVDDSRSARAFLSRILEQHAIEVDTAESAELAIDHLASHRPDVIFMDHLMPGMDGFQAVQLIKRNPRTAAIPIMMYTSQEGELYLGQARALGAVGVLPKQVRPADVSKVLYQLKLVPDRRSTDEGGVQLFADVGAGQENAAAASPDVPQVVRAVEEAVHAHLIELRQSLSLTLEEHGARMASELRTAVQEMSRVAAAEPPQDRARTAPWVLSGLAVLVALGSGVVGYQEYRARQAAEGVLAERVAPATASTAASALPESPAPRVPAQATAPLAAAAPAAAPVSESRLLREAVPFGELPFSGARIESLRAALTRLQSQGFRGVVEIRSYFGRYCLAGNASDGYSLAPEDTPLSRCDLVGNPRDEGLVPAARESLDFANFLGALRASARDAFEVRVSNGDPAALAVPYPPAGERPAAGEWNRAAAANNRIEVVLRPEG